MCFFKGQKSLDWWEVSRPGSLEAWNSRDQEVSRRGILETEKSRDGEFSRPGSLKSEKSRDQGSLETETSQSGEEVIVRF